MSDIEKLLTEQGLGFEAHDDSEAAFEYCMEKGWSDGMPIVLPTAKRVERMLAYCNRPYDQPIALLAPRYGAATPLRLAANAVMAGCKPEYFPLVMLAIEALAEEPFNLYGMQATTHPCAPLIIVNGPIAKEIGMNPGHSALGAGNRANATIGRAIRLSLTARARRCAMKSRRAIRPAWSMRPRKQRRPWRADLATARSKVGYERL
jgi:hypothetical protein